MSDHQIQEDQEERVGDRPGGTLKRAIVLIPGMKHEERNFRRQVLTDNLAAVVQHRRLTPGPEVEIDGEVGQSMIAAVLRGGAPGTSQGPDRIDVFEAHWADMNPAAQQAGPWKKIFGGFALLLYWLLNPKAWRAFHISPMISVGLGFGALLLVLWYISLLLIVAQALSQAGLPETLKDIEIAKQLFEGFIALAARIGDWKLWLVTAALLSFIRVDEVVAIARFTKDYFENRVIEGDEDKRRVGLKDRLRERAIATLERVLAADYDEVIVAAHSFGTVIAVDALREWPHDDDFKRLKLITLGSPLAVLRFRSPWLSDELNGLLSEQRLTRWSDYHAKTDWLCAAVPGQARYFSGHSHALAFEAPLRQRLFGQTHLMYYRDQRILTELAGPL